MTDDTTQPVDLAAPSRMAAEKPRRLGKGLGALLGETRREEPLARRDEPEDAPASGGPVLRMLALATIKPLPGNPRQYFDEAALEELAASIATRGVIQPIIVRPHPRGQGYQLVAGERRWRAAQKARLHEIPALVRTLTDREVMALALIENLQREDLNPVEEARAYQRLSDDEGMIQADIAKMVEKSRSHVANMQRLLTLPDMVLDLVEQSKLSVGHARALVGRDDAAQLAEIAVKEGLSVRDIEVLSRKLAKGGDAHAAALPKAAARRSKTPIFWRFSNILRNFWGLACTSGPRLIRARGRSRSAITTLDQLDLLCQRLTGGEF